ncbi:hypothetical protein AB0K09_23020 [Streptomyces sp. NPDC049577]|uniref:hypothetical protein n=1 Tax=Streptomyces sp. NPDC049577 TaxID=3155153 RepID=UPI00342E39F4
MDVEGDPLQKFVRAALVAACALGAALSVAPAAQAGAGCRYYYSSYATGPNGETTGHGDYAEGDTDPEGRVCQDGVWVGQHDGDEL